MFKKLFKLVFGLILAFIVLMVITATEEPAQDSRSQRLMISASLSNFKVDREWAQFVFTLELRNEQPQENTVHVVVYGKNDMFSPPRRSAWPFPGLLFRQAGTRRGALSSSDISRNWNTRPEDTKGMKSVLKPSGSESLEGALPINETCLHETWRGKPLDPRSMYNEVYLWVFSKDGSLIFEKEYDVK